MIGWAIAIIVLVFFVPITVYAQNQTMDELVNQTVTENAKSQRLIEKMTDILFTCKDRVLELEASILSPCLEIVKAYNQALSEIYSQHRDTVEEILYE
jgi:uncharacterized protein YoxC